MARKLLRKDNSGKVKTETNKDSENEQLKKSKSEKGHSRKEQSINGQF